MREPWFWRSRSLTARTVATALSPLSALYDFGQQARWRFAKAAKAEIPVICIGNASLGGVGKTPFAIALCEQLKKEGASRHFLTRGFGGFARGPLRVDPSVHQSSLVGDEALLLARHGTVWVSADRPAGAEAAAKAGADVIIMDDGFQNPTLEKTCAILLIDAGDPEGNGRVFPAGPMREPLARAKMRADIVVMIGADGQSAKSAAKEFGTPFAAWLEPAGPLAPEKVVAFSGIGKPEKFFQSLRRWGYDVAQGIAYPDHHPFSAHDLAAIRKAAKQYDAKLVTTEKDFARLSEEDRRDIDAVSVRMRINDPEGLLTLLRPIIDRAGASG